MTFCYKVGIHLSKDKLKSLAKWSWWLWGGGRGAPCFGGRTILNFAIAVKLYFVHFLPIKMVVKLKSRGLVWNHFFCGKNAGASPYHEVLGGKMCP